MGGALSQAREAIAAGRGGQLPGLEAPLSQPVSAPARAPLPGPSAPDLRARSHRAVGLGLAALVAGLGLTSWALLRGPLREAPPPPASAARDSGEGAALSADIVNTRIALARRRLEAADYKGAVREVEEALRFDPANAAAHEVLAQARTLDGRVDKAVMEVRAFLAGGDIARAAQAFWDLLEIAPQHKSAVELGPELESAFADRSADARRIMAEARRSAEARGAQGHERYREGVAFVSAAEEAIQTKAFASAAREFLKAAGAFARAEPIAR
jgi:tetratricopeptide (TPR) repeat protein